MALTGRRFAAFRPFGSRIHIEQDIFYLASTMRWSRSDILKMPCSERFRYVKMKEEVERQRRVKDKQASSKGGQRPAGFRRY